MENVVRLCQFPVHYAFLSFVISIRFVIVELALQPHRGPRTGEVTADVHAMVI